MSGPQPPSIPVFHAGQAITPQMNAMATAFSFLLNKAVFRARRTSAWAITEGAHQSVPWDTIDEDSHTGWAAGQPTRYTVQAPGWYLVDAQVSLSGTGAAGMVLIPAVCVNGSSPTAQGSPGWEGPEAFVPTGASTVPKSVPGVWEIYCNTGDYIEIDLWFSTESSIVAADVTAGWQPRVEIVWTGV